ncbi:uncharacterized protein VTP21DRAFT_1292 [Calcarisporiella thermophila]|uniref:uncharacterized protein n=1 Tax=Calcarisporiella thermophila TaxID=911321 RepID=UPI0037447FD0
MPFKNSFIILLIFVGVVAAAPFVTQPITGTVWQAGSQVQIVWTNGTPGPLPIKLMQGDPRALQQVAVITDSADGASGSYAWNIPANLPEGSQYSIALGNPPDINYSNVFTIKAAGAGAAPGGSPSPTGATDLAPGSVSNTGSTGMVPAPSLTVPAPSGAATMTMQPGATSTQRSGASHAAVGVLLVVPLIALGL